MKENRCISRRDFIHAGCMAAAIGLAPSLVDRAEANFRHGFIAPTTNSNRVTINVPPGGFMNLAKSWFPSSPSSLTAAQIDANGYPVGAISAVSGSFGMVANYYGQYIHSWSGTGSMQYIGQDAIIYNGGTFCGLGGNTGSVTANFSIIGASPSVTFKFGALVTAISGGSGSLVTITTASLNFGGGVSTGNNVSFGVGCSSNLINGPNADGSWTVTNVSGTQFTLNGSTGVISPTITGAGGVGTQTEVVFARANTSLTYLSTTFTSFTNLVICTAANAAAIAGGQIYDPVLVAQLQTLKGTPGGIGRAGDFWLRFMDVSGVQGSFECDFSQRMTLSTQCWTNFAPIAAYQAGTITNGGASGNFTDLYSCASNPSNSPASGPPIDCEVIQGACNATNSGGKPGLTVAGRTSFGNWPVIDGQQPIKFNITSGASGAGVAMAFTFSTSAGTWLNGGSPYVFSYTTVSGDTSAATLAVNLQTALQADTTLKAAKIYFPNSGFLAALPPTPLSGVLTIAYTTGPAILTMITLPASTIGSSGNQTFIFNAILGAFIYQGSFIRALPCEAIVELCKRVVANCWYNWPVYTKAAYITAFTNFMANISTGITSGLKFGTEMGNEMWNFGAGPWGRAQALGVALGTVAFPYGSNFGPYSWQGLRTVQYANLSIAAWAGNSRAANDHYIFIQTQVDDTSVGGSFDQTVLQGQFLVTSNSNYANFGGIGGTAQGTSLNTAGNQPVDIATAIGMAPYWGSFWMGGSATGGPNNLNGTVAQNADMLQASFNYANGLTTSAFSLLTNEFNGTTTKSGGSTGAYNLGVSYFNRFVLQEALVAQFDARRIAASKAKLGIIHYEGGPQWGLGAFNGGFNAPNSTAAAITAQSTDLANLVTAMGNLGWTTGQLIPYTISGTGNLTEVATNILQMSQGWKYDTDLNGTAVNTGSYKNFIKTYYYQALTGVSGANRETKGCQYGYNVSQWGFWYSQYNSAGPAYQNYNAIAEYNA